MRDFVKKATSFLLLIIMATLLFSACASQGERPHDATVVPADQELTYQDFSGKIIGVEVGAISDIVIQNDLNATVKYYNGIPEAIQDIRYGRIAGFIWDLSAAKAYAALDDSGDFIVVPVPAEYFFGPLGMFSSHQDLIDRFNEFLIEIEENGIKEEAQHRWLDNTPDLETAMPDIPLTGENGTFKVAISGTEIPFTYVGMNNEYKGYSIELALRFAQREGMNVEFVDMDFSGLIPYVQTGKADFGIANVTITEERRKSILFSDSIYDEALGILTLRPSVSYSVEPVYTDFIGKRFAVKAGTIYDAMATDDFEASETLLFSDYPSIYEAVQRDMADVGMRGYIAARLSLFDSDYSDLAIISLPERFDLPMGAISTDQNIIDSFDTFLDAIKADGTYDEMHARWIDDFDPANIPAMPVIPVNGENGRLVVNTSSDYMPFSFPGDGELLGFDIELAWRFSSYLGMELELVDMAFADILPYVISGKSDIAISYVTITEERKQSVLFSKPYFTDMSAIIYKQGFGETLYYTDFIGKTFAVKNGSVYDYISREIMMASDVMLFEDYPSIYESVLRGRADAGMRGYYAARVSLFDTDYSDLDVIPLPEELHNNPIGAISIDQGMIDAFDEFLPTIKADGTYDDMVLRWFDTFDPNEDNRIPDIELTGANGTLTVATSSDYMPFSYLGDNGKNLGFDIELTTRFAGYLGKDIVIVDMPFSGLLPYVISGKADIGVSDITITEERMKSVLFTDPYFIDKSSIIFKKGFDANTTGGSGSGGTSFTDWLKTGIERNLIVDNRWKMIVNGLGVTMLISILSQIFGTILGCFICFLLLRKNRIADIVGKVYCGIINGTPVVVLLLITYYIIFGNTNINNILVAVAAFTLVTGAGVGQILKGAIDTVDPVEIEAARSIGFSSNKAFLVVTLPQAVRRALPGYMNGFVELVKATAIVGFIAIQDLTRAGDIIRSRTYDAFFPLIFVAVIYLIVTLTCVWIFKRVIKKVSGGGIV